MDSNTNVVAAVVVALGLVGSGAFIGHGMQKLNAGNRYVTVKGLSEKEVGADLVIWPIAYVEAGNQLPEIYARIERNNKLIQDMLLASGLKPADVALAPPKINDNEANNYGNQASRNRYSATVVATVRSGDMKAVQQAMRNSGELVKQGVAVSLNYDAKPEYLFTQLNTIKPALIAEATQNARKAAEQFASDSNSHVGSIRSASQGQIIIADRDSGTPEIKVVRVVSTVEYSLVGD
jgi:hypothetical protein